LLRGDLNNILLKALRAEPDQRYDSPQQLSEDIAHYLNGEPVIARKPTIAYLTSRFIRRHQYAVLMGAIALFILSAWGITALRQRSLEREQARLLRQKLYVVEIRQGVQDWSNGDILHLKKTLEHWLPQADAEDLRGFEWYYLWHFVHPEELLVKMSDEVSQAWLLPGTQQLYVRDVSGNRKVFHTMTGQELWSYQDQAGQGTARDWPLNGEVFALENGNRIVIWDVVRGRRKSEFIDTDAPLQDVSQLDETLFVTVDSRGTVKVRERATGNVLHVFTGIETPVTARTGIGAALALVSKERKITVQPFDKSRLPFYFSETSNIKSLRGDDARQRLLIHTGDGLMIRDSRNGRLLRKLQLPQGNLMSFFFANGSDFLFLISNEHQVSILEAESFRKIGVLGGHQGNVFIQMFLPETNWFVTSGEDRIVRIWDIRSQKEITKFRGHTGDVISATLSADRKKLITGSQDHTARIWDIAQAMQPDVLRRHTEHILTAAFSPDNQHIATAGEDHTAIISNIQNGEQLPLRGHQKMIFSVAFAPDGKTLATGSNDGTAKLWDTVTGKEIRTIPNGSREYWDGVRSLTFTRDGKQLIAGCNDGLLKVWDVNSGQLLTQFRAHEREILSVSLSPDGQRLASGSWDRTAKLWDTATWQELAILKGHQGKVWSTEFSPDGKQLATGSGDFTVKLWDIASVQVIRTLEGHSDGIFSVSFTPDGKRLATCSDDKTVRIWNSATGEEILTLRDHTDEVWRVAFSSDGRTLLSASWDKTARLYRAATEADVTAKLPK
jgi:WD40 repeat protein